MTIRLNRVRKIGRFKSPGGRKLNIWTGDKEGTGIGLLFYLNRGKRVFISDHIFYRGYTKVTE